MLKASAQSKWEYGLEGQTIAAPGGRMPFWLRADQGGSVPPAGTSLSLIGSAIKGYDTARHHKFNWAAGIETRANFGSVSSIGIIQAYLKAGMVYFEFKGGRNQRHYWNN